MAAVAAGLSVVVLWMWLRPGEKRIRDGSPGGTPDASTDAPAS
jgi:hypothetical protein